MLMLIISMLIETKNNSTYLTGYLDEGIRLLLSISAKMSWYIKTFKEKNNKLMPLCVDNDKLLEKYKTIWTKLEDLKKNAELSALPVYDNRCIKNKIRTYDDKVYTSFCSLTVPEDRIESKCFTIIYIDFLLVYENKYYLQVYLDNCAY